MEQRRDLGMKQISFAGGDEEVERKRRCLESSREEKRLAWMVRSQPAGAGDVGRERAGAGVNGCKLVPRCPRITATRNTVDLLGWFLF